MKWEQRWEKDRQTGMIDKSDAKRDTIGAISEIFPSLTVFVGTSHSVQVRIDVMRWVVGAHLGLSSEAQPLPSLCGCKKQPKMKKSR